MAESIKEVFHEARRELGVVVAPFAIHANQLGVVVTDNQGLPQTESLPGGMVCENSTCDDTARQRLASLGERAFFDAEKVGRPMRELFPPEVATPTVILGYLATTRFTEEMQDRGFRFLELPEINDSSLPDYQVEIVNAAHARLKMIANRRFGADPWPMYPGFLPESFSLTDMQDVHEKITGFNGDKANFHRDAKDSEWFEGTGVKIQPPGRGRPAELYTLANKKTLAVNQGNSTLWWIS